MQMAFFHLTNILPGDSALAELQGAIAKSYSSKGQELVERNWQALALARESLFEVPLQPVNAASPNRPPVVSDAAPDFVKTVTAAMLAGLGDALSLPYRRMAPGRWAPPAGKNATSPKRSPSGKKICVPSATTAWRPARTLPFVPKWCRRKRWRPPRPACIPWM
jgi:pyruvate-ferredoxin/flavodoxin oxidoreductase